MSRQPLHVASAILYWANLRAGLRYRPRSPRLKVLLLLAESPLLGAAHPVPDTTTGSLPEAQFYLLPGVDLAAALRRQRLADGDGPVAEPAGSTA